MRIRSVDRARYVLRYQRIITSSRGIFGERYGTRYLGFSLIRVHAQADRGVIPSCVLTIARNICGSHGFGAGVAL